MNKILALDLSLSCSGVAVFNMDGSIHKLISIETNAKEETPTRLKTIADAMIKIKKDYKPQRAIFEQSFSRFNTSTQQIFRVNGVVNYILWDIEQIYFHSTSVRKIVLDKGNAKKDEVRTYILRKYPDLIMRNFDESDAIAVGLAYFKKEGILK